MSTTPQPSSAAQPPTGRAASDPLDIVEEASWESFPASDPPSHTPVTGVGNGLVPAGEHIAPATSIEPICEEVRDDKSLKS